DRGGADADPGDHAVGVAEGDDVADPYRPLEQQDDAADEIGDDLLQAEAEADAERGDEPLQLRPVGADDAEAGDHANSDDKVARDGDGGIARPGIDGESLQNHELEQARKIARADERRDEYQQSHREIAQRDR